ncbi:MAG: hypothetical protein ACK5LP_03995 [Campylobacteraceae bacterium]
MKKKLTALTLMSFLAFNGAQAVDYGFEFGLGYQRSVGYSDAIGYAYPGFSHDRGNAFGEVYAGVPIKIDERLSIIPKLSYMFGFVKVKSYAGNDDYTNSIVLPAVATRYYISDSMPVYVEGELGFAIVNSGKKEIYTFDNTYEVGAFVGYSYKGFSFGDIHADIGYRYIPVDIDYKLRGNKKSHNFGGFVFRLGVTF